MSNQIAACPHCARVVPKGSEEEAQDLVEEHNERRHDGEDAAYTISNDTDDLNDFMDEAQDVLPLERYQELIDSVLKSDAWDVGFGDLR